MGPGLGTGHRAGRRASQGPGPAPTPASTGLLHLFPTLLSPGFCLLSLWLTFCSLDFYP